MTNYFDQEGEVFLKLYKKTNKIIEYWETWNTNKAKAIIHWGQLGDKGQDKVIADLSIKGFRKKLTILINEKISDGFMEIPFEEQYTVAITFKLDTWGTKQDIDRREKIRKVLSEHLGWTGNGRCDDGDIGSGEMTLFADVIDPYIAAKTISKEFGNKRIEDDYSITILKGDEIVEKDYKFIK